MTGQEDVEATCFLLQDRLEKGEVKTPLIVLPIYSQLASEVQAKIFEATD